MPDSLNLLILAEVEHTVDSCAHSERERIIMRGAKMPELLALNSFYLVCFLVVDGLVLPEVPVHAIIDIRREIQVLKQCE